MSTHRENVINLLLTVLKITAQHQKIGNEYGVSCQVAFAYDTLICYYYYCYHCCCCCYYKPKRCYNATSTWPGYDKINKVLAPPSDSLRQSYTLHTAC